MVFEVRLTWIAKVATKYSSGRTEREKIDLNLIGCEGGVMDAFRFSVVGLIS